MSRVPMQEDQQQADPIDLKVMARTHASAALKPVNFPLRDTPCAFPAAAIVITNIVHRVSTSRRIDNAVDGY
jgi:hypothetical protein